MGILLDQELGKAIGDMLMALREDDLTPTDRAQAEAVIRLLCELVDARVNDAAALARMPDSDAE